MGEQAVSGPFWVAMAALLAVQFSQGMGADQLNLYGAFFTCFADNLLLIAEQQPQGGDNGQTGQGVSDIQSA